MCVWIVYDVTLSITQAVILRMDQKSWDDYRLNHKIRAFSGATSGATSQA